VSSLLLSALLVRMIAQSVHAPSAAHAASAATAVKDHTSDAAAVEQPEQCDVNSEQTEHRAVLTQVVVCRVCICCARYGL
jgi:hypothetical protein